MMQDTFSEELRDGSENTRAAGDVLLEHPIPQAEYMYGCTPTAVAMLLGYYDLYGYRGRDFSNLIEGDVQLNERGTDGDAYNMNAFDTTLGRAIATEDYIGRFYERDGVETTPEQELEYSFVEGGDELDTSVWNCLADYLGTGQYWRGMSNRATRLEYSTLEEISLSTRTETITGDGFTKTIESKYLSFLYGLQLYVQTRGYSLDNEITGTYMVDVNGGDFTFADYMAEIDAGRPVLISIMGHTMVGYGYNEETQEIIFDDMYHSDCRMRWDGTYSFSGADRRLLSITTIGLVYSDLNCDLAMADVADNTGIIVSNRAGATDNADYLVANDKLFLNFAVQNTGSDACGAFEMAIYLDGEKVQTLTVDGLSAGATFAFHNVVLDGLTAGTHVLEVVADDGNLILETSGLNNSLEKRIVILTQTPQVISSDRRVASGQNLSNLFVSKGGDLVVSGGGISEAIVQGRLISYDPSTGDYRGNPAYVRVSNGGVVTDVQLYEFGTLIVGNGGLAENVDVYKLGEVVIQDGGLWRGGRMESGGYLIMEGGRAEELELLHGVTVVAENGLLSGVFVEGMLWFQANGAGENITVGRGGTVTAVNGCHIEGAVVTAGGLLELKTGATVSNLRVENGSDVHCSYSVRILGELTLAGTLGTLSSACLSEVEEYVFIVTAEDGYGSILFSNGGFAANSVITINMEDGVQGDYALAYGAMASLASATITVIRGGEEKSLAFNGKKVWADGNRVSLEVDGSSWMLRVVPCLSNVTVTNPDAQARIRLAFNCVEEMTGRFYSWNGGEWTAFNGDKLFFTENGTIQLKLVDDDGVVLFSDVYTLDGFNLLLTGLTQSLPEQGTANALLSWGTDAAWVDLCDMEITVDGQCLLLDGLSDWVVELHAPSASEVTWRVKPVQSDIWTEAEMPLPAAESVRAPQLICAEENGSMDVMLARVDGTWLDGFVARYAGEEALVGVVEDVPLGGMNLISDAFFGSADATRLYLTDDSNGDALFVEDLFSDQPLELETPHSRIGRLDEIYAGAGNDVVDMTSGLFQYEGDSIAIHGGDGDDFLWGGSDRNLLFGDKGDDQLVGSIGDDLLVGGADNDVIYGGGGNDIVAFSAAWGTDEVIQQPGGTVRLWFESGNLDNWDEETLTYRDGNNSVTVRGVAADAISLEFGDNGSEEYAQLSDIGAFAPFTSRTIYGMMEDGSLA